MPSMKCFTRSPCFLQVSLNYSEPTWPRGKAAPYQVQLDMGMLIYAPIDSALVIVRAGDPVPKQFEASGYVHFSNVGYPFKLRL